MRQYFANPFASDEVRGSAVAMPLAFVLSTHPIIENRAFLNNNLCQTARVSHRRRSWGMARHAHLPQGCKFGVGHRPELWFAKDSHQCLVAIFLPSTRIGMATFRESWGRNGALHLNNIDCVASYWGRRLTLLVCAQKECATTTTCEIRYVWFRMHGEGFVQQQ